MADLHAGSVLAQLRRLVARSPSAETDATLLARFVSHRDEAAFAAIVERYGPMVLRVCRRMLPDWPAAEDAFQAVFLVLSRKAAKLSRRERLAGWLHGVACRVAAHARMEAARRRTRESQVPSRQPSDPLDEISARELCSVVDEELNRLPLSYRLPVLLCYVEGQTRDQVAEQLGCSVRTLTRRLERGRELLRTRLSRRGLALPAALLVTGLSQPSASAGLPPILAANTVRLAATFADGGAVAGPCGGLAQGVLQTMSASKFNIFAVLLAGLITSGVGAMALQDRGKDIPAPTIERNDRAAVPTAARDQHGEPLPAGAIGRLGTKNFRHQHTVRAIAVSPDGSRIATASWDGTFRVWNAATGRELRRFGQAGGSAAAFSPDGKLVASGGMDKSLHVWDFESGKEVLSAGGMENSIMSLRFSPDSATLYSLSSPILRAWDLAARAERYRIAGPKEGVYALALSGDGKFLAGGCEDHSIRLWEAATGKEVQKLLGHTDFIYGLDFSPDDKTLASTGADKDRTIRLWDLATGKEIRRIAATPGWVRPIAFAPDGNLLACGSQDSTIFFYDPNTGREVRRCRLPGRGDTWVMSLAFSSDGKRLVTGGTEKVVRLFDVATGKEIPPSPGHQAEISMVAMLPDGRTVLTAGHDGLICRWDRATERITWQTRQAGIVRFLTVAPNAWRALSADGQTLRLWDLKQGMELQAISTPMGFASEGYLRAVALSSDGSIIAAAGWDRTIRLWNATTGEERLRISLASRNKDYRGDCPLVFTPDGKTLISGSADSNNPTIYFWDTATGKEQRRIKGEASLLALSPDGRVLASAGAGKVHLWDVATGKPLGELDCPAKALAFSPGGHSLATGEESGVVQVWELATGRVRRRFAGHETGRGGDGSFAAGVSCLAFSPDGKALLSGGGDTTALIWRMHRHVAPVRSLDALWSDLEQGDAGVAFDAIGAVAAQPEAAVAYLKTHLTPVKAPEGDRVARLLADLDSDSFAVRSQATRQLEQLGEGVLPNLREALQGKLSAEARRRLKQLIEKLESQRIAGERIRELRAVEVLEEIGNPAARAILSKLAQGIPEARLTREAGAAIERLERNRYRHTP